MANLYSVAVHNERIRRSLLAGQRISAGAQRLARRRYLQIEADSREAALDAVEARLPPDEGYVVDAIDLCD